MSTKPDCHRDNLGLDEAELASLTGFTSHAVAALAHLREAWLTADDGNAHAIEEAIGALFQGHSFAANQALFERVLRFGCEADILQKARR